MYCGPVGLVCMAAPVNVLLVMTFAWKTNFEHVLHLLFASACRIVLANVHGYVT